MSELSNEQLAQVWISQAKARFQLMVDQPQEAANPSRLLQAKELLDRAAKLGASIPSAARNAKNGEEGLKAFQSSNEKQK